MGRRVREQGSGGTGETGDKQTDAIVSFLLRPSAPPLLCSLTPLLLTSCILHRIDAVMAECYDACGVVSTMRLSCFVILTTLLMLVSPICRAQSGSQNEDRQAAAAA